MSAPKVTSALIFHFCTYNCNPLNTLKTLLCNEIITVIERERERKKNKRKREREKECGTVDSVSESIIPNISHPKRQLQVEFCHRHMQIRTQLLQRNNV